jgi:hypothetical protein
MRTEPVLIGVVAGLILLVVVVAVMRPVRRRLFAGSGWEEWRRTAAQLPWRDRWSLYVANSRGRAPHPRLAPLAVERGEVVATMVSASAHRRRGLRWVLYAAGALALAGLGLNVAAFVLDGDGGPLWLSAPSTLLTVVLAFAHEPLMRRQAELVRRSVQRSRELLG